MVLGSLLKTKNRKGLSIILRPGKIPFEFHQGILFDTVDDLFDRNFRSPVVLRISACKRVIEKVEKGVKFKEKGG